MVPTHLTDTGQSESLYCNHQRDTIFLTLAACVAMVYRSYKTLKVCFRQIRRFFSKGRFGLRTAISHFATVATASTTPEIGRSFEIGRASHDAWPSNQHECANSRVSLEGFTPRPVMAENYNLLLSRGRKVI